MPSPKARKPSGRTHDVAPRAHASEARKGASSSAPSRTDTALEPTKSLEVLIRRALDQELDWYFAYGEAAFSRGNVTILPSYAAVRALATEPDSGVGARAVELARTVRTCLLSLRPPHASVLRTAYTPRRLPEAVTRAFQSAAPIAVRLALADDPWPARRSRSGLEEATANRLRAAIACESRQLRVDRLRARAVRLLGHAIVAYTEARASGGVALGVA